MPSLTLKYGTVTNSSGQSTFHIALIVNSPDINIIFQSDGNGKLSLKIKDEISREYSFTKSFGITKDHFESLLAFSHNLLEEMIKEQTDYKFGTYALFFLQLAGLFPYEQSDFPAEIPAEIANYLYSNSVWDNDINGFTKFATTIDKEFTPELMLKLSNILSQKSEAEPEPKPDVKSQPESESEESKKIKFFKRIYQALRYGESSFFKEDFLAGKANFSVSQMQDALNQESSNPDSQTSLAWRYANSYFYLTKISGYKSITMDNNTQLFFSICKNSGNNDFHTFITVSLHDKLENKSIILFRIKIKVIEGEHSCYDILFGSLPSSLVEESSEQLRKITYKSFEITMSQYTELLQHVAANINIDYLYPRYLTSLPGLETISGGTAQERAVEEFMQKTAQEHVPCAFIAETPSAEDAKENKPRFKKNKIMQIQGQTKQQIAGLLNSSSPYNKFHPITHNCRHAGIELFDATFKHLQGKKLFSSNGLTDFPYTGLIYNGEFIGHHYILPAPPNKDTLDHKLYKILARLYKRLEEIPKLKPDSQLTMDKFNALKDLYHSLAPAQALGLDQLLTVINTWESTGKNKDIVDTHRGVKFFSNTSTRNSITELKTLAEIKPPNCSWFGCS